MVETVDIFPTVAELAGLAIPAYVQGQSLVPILKDPRSKGHAAVSYHRNHKSIRTDKYRLIQHKDGYAELYDHSQPAGETVNIAEANPKVVERLGAKLIDKMRDKTVAR
jgi:iduronate 2-sulfatase